MKPVRQEKPDVRCFKLNTDVSSLGNPGCFGYLDSRVFQEPWSSNLSLSQSLRASNFILKISVYVGLFSFDLKFKGCF